MLQTTFLISEVHSGTCISILLTFFSPKNEISHFKSTPFDSGSTPNLDSPTLIICYDPQVYNPINVHPWLKLLSSLTRSLNTPFSYTEKSLSWDFLNFNNIILTLLEHWALQLTILNKPRLRSPKISIFLPITSSSTGSFIFYLFILIT